MVDIFKVFKNNREHNIKVGYFNNGKTGTTIADIARWNEFGTYVAPARPFIRNTIANNRKKWFNECVNILEKDSFIISSSRLFELANLIKKDLITEIENGDFEPNAPITIEGGWMANKKSKKPFKVEGKGDKKPLSNKGGLVNSIEIRVGGTE